MARYAVTAQQDRVVAARDDVILEIKGLSASYGAVQVLREVDLTVGAQVEHRPQPELLDEQLDVGLGQVLQVVRAQQHARSGRPPVDGRQTADIANVHRTVEVDPGHGGMLARSAPTVGVFETATTMPGVS
mgnify:CR=1 FL=1